MKKAKPFVIPPDGKILPGESIDIRFTVSENYLGDPVRIPVTILHGKKPGPCAFLTAASHGDELNGVQIIRHITNTWDPDNLSGTIICLPVLNVPAFLAQQRYLPTSSEDLNRSFPGSKNGKSIRRMAYSIFKSFIQPCDFGIDFHTSTRGRSNMLHVLADLSDKKIADLAHSFGSNIIIDGQGPLGSLRRAASQANTPSIAVELGEAHRFQSELIDRAIMGLESTFASYNMRPTESVIWPGWKSIINNKEDTWVRSTSGGIVNLNYNPGDLVEKGNVICTITNPFNTNISEITSPFTGLIIGLLQNPIVRPGDPIFHLVSLDKETICAYHDSQSTTDEI
tara:strand:+ start:901 stop:1920 length:1020 start_codon:yes stop_codon:yes gene_type:complete